MANGIKRFKELSENYMDNPRILRNMLKNMQELCEELKSENIKLKAQLTWRPVSERPEKDGWYLCKVLYVNDTIGEETVHFDGERFVFSNVVKWLPIPPAPEGE